MKNVLTAGKKLKASKAAIAGDLLQAQVLYASVCKLNPTDVEAWVKLALVEKGLGNYPAAERCARRALKLDPKLGYAHYALGQALHSQQQRDEAIVSYRAAIALLPELADAHFLLGLALREAGAISQAMSSLQQALYLRPEFPQAMAEMGALYLNMGQPELGHKLLQHAARLKPLDSAILGNLSHALRLLGFNREALDGFRQALQLEPDNLELIGGLAGLLEKAGAIEEAQSLLTRGLKLSPGHVTCNLIAAQLERRAMRLQAAVDRLQGLLVPALTGNLRAEVMLELGQIYDQMGDAARAYPLIAAGKREKAIATLGSETDHCRAYLARLARIRQLATPALGNSLRSDLKMERPEDALDSGLAAPVFLIGFPRSGTTLMEQILDSHPNIQAMEEKSTVSVMVNRALDMLDQQQCALTDLTDEQVTELRQLYFAEASKYVNKQAGSLLVDKMPLNTVGVPVIAKVFPTAKFILAIRHPCDVSLSCLMQNFATNAGMANFFTIEDTAHLYAQVMGTWQHYVETLPLQYHQIRYEDLIEDVPSEARRLLDFLGLPWNDAVLKHTEHARQRGAINTPSYHQVVQPIYQRSKYRWTRYEKELSGVMPMLQPFVEKFGYA